MVDLARLLVEAAGPLRLARWPDPSYTVVQFSSTDRRSRAPGQPGWFANADGFGGEPIPGFAAVLEPPGEDGIGRYLVCDVTGPGAIVRGWSAGMGGTLRVWLDEESEPLWAGRGDDFLARRSEVLVRRAGLALDLGDAFRQEDADYLPVPFARRLRVVWEGKLRELHFYHLELRRYPPGTPVRSFNLDELAAAGPLLEQVAAVLRRPPPPPGRSEDHLLELPAGGTAALELPAGPRALVELHLRPEAPDPAAFLRGTLLRLVFDGARRPQVEVPLGDFFATFPGLRPFRSQLLEVRPDGTLVCRFPMPWLRRARHELAALAGGGGRVAVKLWTVPWTWGTGSLHFHASWRHGAPVSPDAVPLDLDFLHARGSGRLVGLASLLLNPSPCPTPAGSWWGEGDEKFFVDGAATPAFLGTGSEDYYNYSWSRPDLFAHPWCGQPVDTGPANAGYVVDFRLQVLDDLPFTESLDAWMELWPHRAVAPIPYARLAWWYGAPGAVDEVPVPGPEELRVPVLPRWEPQPWGGATGATFLRLEELSVLGYEEELVAAAEPLASRGRVQVWRAAAGARLPLDLELPEAGEYAFHLVARHSPEGGGLRLLLDGQPLPLADAGGSAAVRPGADVVPLRTTHGRRLLDLGFGPVAAGAGRHRLELECAEAGDLAFDYLWWKLLRPAPRHLPGAVEGEDLEVVAASPGVAWEVQELDPRRWSGGRHLWIRCRRPGDFVELLVTPPSAGRYRVQVYLTSSWDYGVADLFLDGRLAAGPVDTFRPGHRVGLLPPLDLGVHRLAGPFRLRLAVVGGNPEADSPGSFLGLDCVVLEPAAGGPVRPEAGGGR